MTDEEKRLRRREAEKRYQKKHRDKHLEKRRRHRERHREAIAEKQRAYVAANPEAQAARAARWRSQQTSDPQREIAYRIKMTLHAAQYRAEKAGMAFDLTLEDVPVPATCPILGIPLKFGRGKSSGNSPSIDRIDNTKGYIKGNVAVISMRANTLKGDMTADQLRAILRYIERKTK